MNETKICPLLAMSNNYPGGSGNLSDVPYCLEDQCAWWTIWYPGTKYEKGECIIQSLAALSDLAGISR